MDETNNKQGNSLQTLVVALLFCAACIAVNIAGNRIVGALHLPVFLDCVGTMAGGMLGGPVAGLVVAYFTNLINSFYDSAALYYGVVNVLIAVTAALFMRQGWFKRVPTTLLSILLFALIGGGLSSVITWCIFGFGVDGAVSTPLAQTIFESFVPSAFGAQFMADFSVDLIDKAISVCLSLLVVQLLPETFKRDIDFSLWMQKPLSKAEKNVVRNADTRVTSVRTKIAAIVSVIMIVVGLVVSMFSFDSFNQSMVSEKAAKGYGITSLAHSQLDANRVGEFLERGDAAPGYAEAEQSLARIRDSFSDVEYIYVYQIREDGCHVVLDPDTQDEPGADPGSVVPFDDAFKDQLDELLAGAPIEPVVSNESYGWLLSVYEPMLDDNGVCVAYVAADIYMDHVIADGYAFLARLITLCASFFILVCFLVIWLSDYGIILPINSIAAAASSFAFDTEDKRGDNVERMRELNVHTGDEIENLFVALCKTTEDSVSYIDDAAEKAKTIERMQDNLIMVMADLVESRDQFTGEHVRKTAAYVRIIMAEMKREGVYADQLTDKFMYDVAHSAPLHDIGKIVVSDTILNKPGRLTDEEFEIMKRHTIAGAEILDGVVDAMSDPAYLDEARRLAIGHHEKWNGQGYPYGLSGEDIPLSARIMAVADVFDALVSKRSYKDGFPIEKALDIIREGIATHFDPKVAQAFLNAEDEVRRIAAEHSDKYGG